MKEAHKRLSTEYLSVLGVRSEADRLEFMKISRLDCIADALEKIDDNLDSISASLEALENCTTKNPNGTRSMMALISGRVETY